MCGFFRGVYPATECQHFILVHTFPSTRVHRTLDLSSDTANRFFSFLPHLGCTLLISFLHLPPALQRSRARVLKGSHRNVKESHDPSLTCSPCRRTQGLHENSCAYLIRSRGEESVFSRKTGMSLARCFFMHSEAEIKQQCGSELLKAECLSSSRGGGGKGGGGGSHRPAPSVGVMDHRPEDTTCPVWDGASATPSAS